MAAGPPILLYMFVSLALGALTTWCLTRIEHPLPYTCILFLEGALIASIHGHGENELHDFTDSVTEWLRMDGNLLLFIFLPPLLYGEAMSLNWFHTKEVVWQCATMAFLGVIIESFIVGPLMYATLPHEWPFKLCMLVASIMSATDPVAVVALLKDMNASTQLTMLIVGESLMNDGTGMALFELFKGMMEGEEYASSPANILLYVFKVVFVSPLIGLAVGLCSVVALRYTNRNQHNEKLCQITITLVSSYSAFYFAQYSLEMSGVLSTCTAGLCVAKWGSPLVLDHHMMHTVWDFIEWAYNTILFMLAGLFFVDRATVNAKPRDYGYVVLVYLFLLLSRSICLVILYPLINKAGDRQISWEDATFMAWSGLRGALGIALGLVVIADHHHMGISEDMANQVFLNIGGVTTLTLVVNATTARYILNKLGLIGVEDKDKLMTIHMLRLQMDSKLLKQLSRMKKSLGISRGQVLSHLTLLKTDLKELRERKAQQMLLQESESSHWLSILRNVYLDVVRVEYWHDIDSGKLPRLDSSGPYMLYTVDKAEAKTDTHAVGEVDLDKIIKHTDEDLDVHVRIVRYALLWFPENAFLKELETAYTMRCQRLRIHLLSSYMSAHEKAEKKMIEMGLISTISLEGEKALTPDTPGTPSVNVFEVEGRKDREKTLHAAEKQGKSSLTRELSAKNLAALEANNVSALRPTNKDGIPVRRVVDGISVLRTPEPTYEPLNLAENNALPEHGDHPLDDGMHDDSTPGVMRTKRKSCGNGSRVLSESRRAVGRARQEVDSMDPYMVREVLSLQVAQSVLHMGMTVVGGMVKEGLLSEKDSEEFFISFDKDRRSIDAEETKLFLFDPEHGISHDALENRSDADISYLDTRTPSRAGSLVDGLSPGSVDRPGRRSNRSSFDEELGAVSDDELSVSDIGRYSDTGLSDIGLNEDYDVL